MSDTAVIGMTLTPEQWRRVADGALAVYDLAGKCLERMNVDGKGKRDRRDLIDNAQCVYNALIYVSEFASDKVRFVTAPDQLPGNAPFPLKQ